MTTDTTISPELAALRADPAWAEYGTNGRRVLLSAVQMAAIMASTDPLLADVREKVSQAAVISDKERDAFVLAQEYAQEGDLEFDADSIVSMGEDHGAYVSGFKWISFDDTPLDEEADSDEGDVAAQPMREGG